MYTNERTVAEDISSVMEVRPVRISCYEYLYFFPATKKPTRTPVHPSIYQSKTLYLHTCHVTIGFNALLWIQALSYERSEADMDRIAAVTRVSVLPLSMEGWRAGGLDGWMANSQAIGELLYCLITHRATHSVHQNRCYQQHHQPHTGQSPTLCGSDKVGG